MKIKDLLKDKYVIVRNPQQRDQKYPGQTEYWLEGYCGYTNEITDAGLYDLKEVRNASCFIKVISLDDYHEGKHLTYDHYAVELTTLLSLM